MRNIFVFLWGLFTFTNLYSQNNTADSTAYYNKIFGVVQQKPKFQGNQAKWIAEHTVYPKEASDSNIEGTVYLSLIIETDGSVDSVKVMKGVEGGGSLDKEAIRVVSAMPKWSPGVENGHIVKVELTLPVNFKIAEDPIYGYSSVQVKPVFAGNVMQWIEKNTPYPKIIVHGNIEDTVYISFIVEKDGSVSHIEVLKGVSNYLDREAKWIVSKMPKWKPGMKDGQAVRVICSAPIYFVLKDVNSINSTYDQKKAIDTIYTKYNLRIIRENPKFPGDINKWLSDHVKYPETAKDANIQGTVYISFVVEKDGSISSVRVLRGVCGNLNNEAIRVVSSMPKWAPGKINGQPVRVQFMLPIHFILN